MRISRTNIAIVASSIILLVIVAGIFIISLNTDSQPGTTEPALTPSPKTKPLNIKLAPTASLEKGGGTDVNSQIVKNSIAEITKLYPLLPFERNFTSSNNVEVSILIPRSSLQINRFTLRVQVFGINYNTSPGEPDYEIMKKSFLEATDVIFAWIRQNSADPEKIIFVWGDKKFIQDQATNWLGVNN